MNQLNPSLGFEMKQPLFKNDSVNKIQFDIENYKKEAIRARRKESLQYHQEELRKNQMRNDLLKHNQSQGKSTLNL